jgi:acetylornithine deacetylase/succinyl-diaminopimelate desuccinylase-like protein
MLRAVSAAAEMTLRDEATGLLQSLIRLDTVNPPGNETMAAELLAGYLSRNGVDAQLYARVPERANLVARIPGGDGPTLAFLCHTDTVLADPGEWDRDPWSGDVVDGEVWGRGALDMKDQVAANAVAFASVARDGFEPTGDLLFIATADEEVGGDDGYGLVWLCETHPDAVRCDYAINEGGGERLVVGDHPVYFCATAEKMSAPFTVRVHGRSGHASMPGIADNALVKSARYIEALGAYEPPRELIVEAKALFEAVLGEVPPLEEALARAAAAHPLLPALVEPLLAFTLSPTMIDASHQRNVIPARCEITVDCRLLPETTPTDVEPLIRAALGEGRYDLEFAEAVGGTRSPLDTALWEALRSFTEGIEPGARLAPVACAGFTDSHFLRRAFGTVAYGYFPIRHMDTEVATKLVHSANERIRVDDLALGVDMLRSAAHTLLAP